MELSLGVNVTTCVSSYINRIIAGASGPQLVYTNNSPVVGVEPIPAQDLNANEGTYILEFTDSSFQTGDDKVLLSISDGTSASRIFVQKRSTQDRFRVLSGMSGQLNEIWDGYLSTVPNGTHKIAIGYSGTKFRVWFDGMLIAYMDDATHIPFTQIDTGKLVGSSSFDFAGTLDSVNYYDGLVDDATGAALTNDVEILSSITYDADRHIYMMLGQSNSSGVATTNPTYSNPSDIFLLGNDMTIAAYSDAYDDDTGSLIPALDDSTADGSYAGAFADDLAGLSGNDITVCPANLAGTGFFSTLPTWNVDDDLYRTSGSRIKGMNATCMSAILQMQMARQFGPVRGIIWGQGEADVAADTAQLDYEGALTKLISQVRLAADNLNLPWFNGSMPNYPGWATQTAWEAIDNAQQNVANNLTEVYYVTGNNVAGATGDEIHYDEAGNNTVGGNFATAVNTNVYNNPVTVPATAMSAGQSLIDDLFDDDGGDGSREGYDAFIAASGVGSDLYDAAVGNTALTKTVGDEIGENHWVDDSGALADGALLTSYLSIVDSNTSARTEINCVIWQQWNASRTYVTETGAGSGEITPAEYEAALDYLISRWRAEHGSDVKIIFGLPHRRTSGTEQHDYACQKMREIYISKADGDVNIFAVEHCDIDLADATHHTVAGKTEFGSRMGAMANYALNGGTMPDYPVLQAATINYNEITMTFSSDITAPSSGVGQCAAAQNFAIKTGTTLTRTAANTAVFTLGDNQGLRLDDTPQMRVSSGVNSSLSQTSADTLNNAGGTLPARGSVVNVTSNNPILDITDVTEFWTAKHATKTFSAGNSVTSLEGLKGAGFENNGGTEPEYDSTLFGGAGGIKATAAGTCFSSRTAFTAGGTHTIFGVISLPASSNAAVITTFGNVSGSSTSNARLFINGSGNIVYGRSQANGFPVLETTGSGAETVFCLRYNDNGSMDHFFNSTTSGGNIDPRDDYQTLQALHLFARFGTTDSAVDVAYGAYGFAAGTALTNQQISDIITELGSHFSITIS